MNPREQGFESQLYVNTGSYGTPVWTLIDLARDLNDLRDHAETDVTSRGTAKLRLQASQAGTTPRGFEFESLVPAAAETNDAYNALMAAAEGGSNVDLLHVEGGDINVDSLPAERLVCCVTGGGKGEPLNGASTRNFKAIWTPNSNQTAGPEKGVTASGEFVANS